VTEIEQRAAVITEAKRWLRTPYHHHARVLGAGVDCAMFLIAAYSAAGVIEDFDPGYYPMDWMLHRSDERYLGKIQERAKEIEFPPCMGDLVVYKIGRCFAHGAIVIEWPLAIHSRMPTGVEMIDLHVDKYFDLRPRKFYTLWGK